MTSTTEGIELSSLQIHHMTVMSLRLCMAGGVVLLLAACGQKNQPARPQAASIPTNLDAATSISSAAVAAVPTSGGQRQVVEAAASQGPVPPPVSPPVVAPGADVSAALGQLTQALRKYSVEHRRVPASLSEVISAGYVNTLPKPPPGKQFAIDKDHVQVVLRPQ